MDDSQAKLKQLYNITQWDEYGINFWGIPKCMNTSIKLTLMRSIDVLPEELMYKSMTTNSYQKVHMLEANRYITPEIANNNGNVNFSVIRNPMDRVISLYKDFVLKRSHLKIDGINLNPEMSLRDFCKQLSSTNDLKCNIHIKSQYAILKPARQLKLFNDATIRDFFYEKNIQQIAHVNKSEEHEIVPDNHVKASVRSRYRKDFNLASTLNIRT